MTKKNYQAIADALIQTHLAGEVDGMWNVAAALCKTFTANDASFDEARFTAYINRRTGANLPTNAKPWAELTFYEKEDIVLAWSY